MRSLRDQCRASGTSFFFKQWGGVRKSETGRKLDNRTHDDQPAVREAELPVRRVRLQMVGEYER